MIVQYITLAGLAVAMPIFAEQWAYNSLENRETLFALDVMLLMTGRNI